MVAAMIVLGQAVNLTAAHCQNEDSSKMLLKS